MGRPAMSAEEVRNNKISIINAAREMIRENGTTSVSARALGTRTGMNSALIYRYFQDIDEVVLFACVHVLQEYTYEMARSGSSENLSDTDLYLRSWELFSKHAFSNPDEYHTLFFSRHSDNLQNVIRDYYELFPNDLSSDDDIMLEAMFRTSDLRNRNLMLLIPVLEGRLSEDRIILINDMTISYFYSLLSLLLNYGAKATAESQKERMLSAVRFTIGL